MAERTLKWVGLAESEYISRCGTFMVQLQGKDWHLFRRVNHDTTESESGLKLPKWGWSVSLFSNKKKGICQDMAEQLPLVVDDESAPEPAKERGERRALTRFESNENSNASCYDCGVPFMKKPNHKWGDLCGSNCAQTMAEILSEIEGSLELLKREIEARKEEAK